MRRRHWKLWIWHVICPVLSILLFLYTFWGAGAFSQPFAMQEVLCTACDACFACGIVFLVLFVIRLCLRHGAFGTLRYGAAILTNTLSKGSDKEQGKKGTDAAEYYGKRKTEKNTNLVCLYFALFFLLLGCVLLFIYMEN